MVFLRDAGSEFDAPLDRVWAFVGSGDHHSQAHRHTNTRRRRLPGNAGEYSWKQPFRGRTERFTMRWRSYHPLGVGYEVLAGPFEGSRFFLFYRPRGGRTGVEIVGEFVSPTLPARSVRSAVRDFFAVEFEQDRAAIEAGGRAPPRPRGRAATLASRRR
jgi:hypothetical protein